MLKYSLALLVAVFSSPLVALADFSELAVRVPENANAIVLIDVDKIMASPAADRGKWKEKVENAFAEGLTILPPSTKRAILASQIDVEFMSTIWQTEILEADSTIDGATIAKRTGGETDRIGEWMTVRLPHDAYIVHFARSIYGVMMPANRQSVVHWLREVQNRKTPKLSPYLEEAYGYAADIGTPIIMSIDLENAVSESIIRERVRDNWRLAGFEGKADPLAVVKVLASIRGATLGITLRDKPFGKIKIDFAEDAKPLAAIAKPLFLHVLDRRGLTIEEFEEWNYTVSGKSLTLEGHFTSSGLRRIFSMFDRPTSMPSSKDTAETKPEKTVSKEEAMGQATLAYYQNVQRLLKDLQGRKSSSGGTYTTGSIAKWCTNYSRKINTLPLLNVDPEMIAYGNQVSNTLIDAASVLNGGNVQGGVDARNAQPVYNTFQSTDIYGYGYRGGLLWGGMMPMGTTNTAQVIDQRATQAERDNIKANARAQSSKQAREILTGINQATADIRAKMVQKYQLEF